MANRNLCTKELTKTAVAMKQRGILDKDIATALGVAPTTFCTWKTHPRNAEQREFSEAIKRAEVEMKLNLVDIIMKEAQNRTWQAAAWLLERKFPDEYARPDVQFAKRAAREAAEEAMDTVKGLMVKIAEVAGGGHRADTDAM